MQMIVLRLFCLCLLFSFCTWRLICTPHIVCLSIPFTVIGIWNHQLLRFTFLRLNQCWFWKACVPFLFLKCTSRRIEQSACNAHLRRTSLFDAFGWILKQAFCENSKTTVFVSSYNMCCHNTRQRLQWDKVANMCSKEFCWLRLTNALWESLLYFQTLSDQIPTSNTSPV